MTSIIIYSTKICPYCVRAKQLLHKKNAPFTEVFIDEDAEKRAEMEQRSHRRTVPQIFIGDTHVGGCDDLYALEHAGKLDELLASVIK